jgi:hypothetical protein
MKMFTRMMICLMISFTLVELPVMKAHAGMISTTEVMTEITRAEASANVTNFLARTDVMDQLIKLGVNPEEATSRIASLSDSEVKKLNTDIQQATVGGSVVGILILVLIILGIIYLAKRI